MVHREHGLAIVEGAQGQVCMASGVSPCPPLVPTRLASLGTQRCHSGWQCHQMCPWDPGMLSMAKAWRWALEKEGGTLACGPWARSSPPELRVPRLGGSGAGAGLGGVQLWVSPCEDGVVGLVPLRSCHGRFSKQESSQGSFFFFPRQGLQPQPGCCRNRWRWFRP